MKSFLFKLFLLITLLVVSSGDLSAQVNWTKYPGNPVLQGQPGTWYAYTTMNSVLYNADSSRYEMWFTAGAQVGYPYTIGFAWSSDGINWNVYSPNPVLTPTSGSWDAYMVLAPYVIRENGQYKMWYTGCATSSILDRIGYATSPDGINWTKHPSNPVLLPGTAPWESAAVAYPCIMPDGSGYKMWYSGYNANLSVTGIGYASSPDGITWEKYANNPVLPPGASGQWDHVVFGPRILFIDNNYYMFYTGETVGYQSDKIGLATSPDGLAWTKYPSNPVLQPSPGQWDGGRTNSGYVLLDADTLKMYYCGLTVGNTNMQLGLAASVFSPPLLTGDYTIGTGGNFATIQEAFDKVSNDGIAGAITLELIDELYIAPTDTFGFKLNGPIPGASPNSRVTIKPAENKNVLIQGSGRDQLAAINTSYVTIDGVSLTGPTTLTVHALYNDQFGWNACIEFIDNSDHNIFRNITFISDDINRAGGGPGLYTRAGINAVADSNLIENNFIKKCGVGGIYLTFDNSSLRGTGNIIRGNFIGSETDSLCGWGIQIEHAKNTIVENNIIKNLKHTPTSISEILNVGINSYSGLGDIIRNNVVYGIRASSGYTSTGILLSGGSGSNNMVYNNMVYDIQSSSTQSNSRVAGIQIWLQNNPKIYYNTVYLSGTGANPAGSAAFYDYGGFGGSSSTDVKNNIFVNTRDESPYCASAIYDYQTANRTSDYNDLYYDDTNNNNCLVRIGMANYHTLADWQVTGKDLNSITEMPSFVAPDLHIDWNIYTLLDGHATPIVGITTDIDGESRNTVTPDIGADEFVYVPVELISFTATSNGKEVILNWSTATELNNQMFEVQRSFEGSDFASVGFINGKGTTTERHDYIYRDKILTDGKYAYRLKQIDYLGRYEYSEIIEIELRVFNSFLLEQNYPNPFNPATTIGYGVKEKSSVKITVLNSIGEEVAMLINEEKESGYHTVEFNASSLPSGVYFYQLRAGSFVETKKMILLK